MAEDEIVETYEDIVQSEEYQLKIQTIKRHWPGHGSGKMEDRPGDFLETTVTLVDFLGEPSHLMSIAVENQVVLYDPQREQEITNEPEGYAKLKHEDFVERVRATPGIYTDEKTLKEAVMKSLE